MKALPIIRLKVAGDSMAPSFCDSSYIWINRLAYKLQKPRLGDVVVIKKPRTNKLILKRIVSVGNTHIHQQWGRIFCNYERIGHIHLASVFSDRGQVRKSWNVKKNQYFLLGDNLEKSTDSRHFGAVHRKRIIGKVMRGRSVRLK